MPHIEHTEYYSNILGTSLKVEVTGITAIPIIMFPTSGDKYPES